MDFMDSMDNGLYGQLVICSFCPFRPAIPAKAIFPGELKFDFVNFRTFILEVYNDCFQKNARYAWNAPQHP
jgi:hypothetical protein